MSEEREWVRKLREIDDSEDDIGSWAAQFVEDMLRKSELQRYTPTGKQRMKIDQLHERHCG